MAAEGGGSSKAEAPHGGGKVDGMLGVTMQGGECSDASVIRPLEMAARAGCARG